MKVTATAKQIRVSPRKVNLVAGLIRGQSVDRAKSILATTPKQATEPVGQVLASAVANAEHNYNLAPSDLVIEQILVGPARTIKRYRPRARGMAFKVRYRTSHISLTLAQPQSAAKSASPDDQKTTEQPKAESSKRPVKTIKAKAKVKK